MSTAALMWVHDDHDVIGQNVRYLLTQVDEVLIRHRDGQPATLEILHTLARHHDQIRLREESDDRYDQSAVMTEMAQEAGDMGHQWVVPVDPDEIWYVNHGSISDFFLGISRDVMIVRAELYNHVPTGHDPKKGSPFETMGWRQKRPLGLGKVACRVRPDLVIEHGNHNARSNGVSFTVGPLMVVRHFPYRTPEQFIERVRSAYDQLKKSRLPEVMGVHIRAYGKCLEEEGEDALRDHFMHWFYSPAPTDDDTIMYDPAPLKP